MSMNDVIDQIAIAAEQKSQNNLLWVMSRFSGLLTPEETRPEDLSPERIQELDQRIRELGHLPPPRLTFDEINGILSDYPYKLSVEFYDLYQRGNGVLPIGVGDTDWDCYVNYFHFLDGDISWEPLQNAMEYYRELVNYQLNMQPKAFPFMAFEHTVWVVVGSDIQQLTSPVFTFTDSDNESWKNPMRMVWNSLTEMFSVDLSDWNNWSIKNQG
ncbi:MAG: hypothetical protein KME16_27645 [Scytolyngbya sp. HA4215-MV1]|nr:hypothetical protein [Scytolyngbya sp. HA4215-MV1]